VVLSKKNIRIFIIMKLSIYQVDAFTNKVFSGNPACVVPLKSWIDDFKLLQIARENAVPETAFFVKTNNGFHLRWFTPEIEMDLCGHATLATAFVIINYLNYEEKEINFSTLSGKLKVKYDSQFYTLDFPSRVPVKIDLPEILKNTFSIKPIETLKARDYLLVYENELQIQNITFKINLLNKIDIGTGGVIITSKGEKSDFVSRYFTPNSSIIEDPVTGSAHCSLIPYWSKKLNKKKMMAIQLSQRKGELTCEDKNERVLISGKAIIYSIGNIWI
tara:strand:+ start:27815 stop:28639 length:825 start_codon:yes stop_codon:yes gene_type:complete